MPTNLADAYESPSVGIYVDVVLQEVSVVGHHWPILSEETWDPLHEVI